MAQPTSNTLLVLPLRAEGALAESAKALDELLLDQVFALGRYQVIGASDLNALLGIEKLKDAAGCDDVACAAELGGALGAPWLLAGQLSKLGSEVVVSLKLLDTKTPKVVNRASVRGKNDPQAVAALLNQALAKLFGTPAPTATVESPASSSNPNNPYADYMTMMTALSKRMSQFEYTAVLADLKAYRQTTINAPPGQDVHELLAYYEVLACSMLKRHPCVQQSAQAFLKAWPDGVYSNGVRGFVTQIEDDVLEREARAPELTQALSDIAKDEKAGRQTQAMAERLRAYAYFSAKRYDDAAQGFARVMSQPQLEAGEWFDLVGTLVSVLELAGRFDEARTWLEKAEQRDGKQYRLNHLHQRKSVMPR